MEALGFSTDARTKNLKWDLSDSNFQPTTADAAIHRLQASKPGMECATPKLDSREGEGEEERRQRQQSEVQEILSGKVVDARSQGLNPAGVTKLEALLAKFVDVFRTDVGADPPIKVEPLKVHLKPGSVPVKSSMRRYPPEHVEFLKRHVDQLEAASGKTWPYAPMFVIYDQRGTI